MMILERHPADYKLIAEIGVDYEKRIHTHRHLMRIHPERQIPDGWKYIDTLFGKSVYQNGMLCPRFMALKRFEVKSGKS